MGCACHLDAHDAAQRELLIRRVLPELGVARRHALVHVAQRQAQRAQPRGRHVGEQVAAPISVHSVMLT